MIIQQEKTTEKKGCLDLIIEHIIPKVVVLGIVTGVCVLVADREEKKGELVYWGTINDSKVEYRENSRRHYDGLVYIETPENETSNRMIVKEKDDTKFTDGTVFTFEDVLEEKPLDIQPLNTPIDTAELENVVVEIDGNTFSYSPSDINDSTRDGKYARDILDKANKEYNLFRAEIARIKVSEYEKLHKSIEDKLAK